MRSIQSVRQATRADWGASVPGWIQETFILLFSLGTMCWSGEAAPSSRAHEHKKTPGTTDGIWTFTTGALCLRGSDATKQTQLESSSYYKNSTGMKSKKKKECALSLPLWLRCVSTEALCISIHFLCRFNRMIKNEKRNVDSEQGLIYGADNRRQLQWTVHRAIFV